MSARRCARCSGSDGSCTTPSRAWRTGGRRSVLRLGGAVRTLVARCTLADGTLRLVRDGRALRGQRGPEGDRLLVGIAGRTFALTRERARRAHRRRGRDDEAFALSPMTGTLAKVAVAPGQALARARRCSWSRP